MTEILSLNQLFAERVHKHPDLQVLCIPDKNFDYIKYTTSGLDVAASLLANHLKDSGTLPGRAKGDTTSRLTVGLLGVCNVDYVVTEMALFRMGYCALLLSPNNSPPATAHLVTATNASHIIVQDASISSAIEVLSYLADPSSLSIVRQPPSDVFGSDARMSHPDKIYWDPPLSPESEHLLPIMIIHSSGSTNFPKPIAVTNKAITWRCRLDFLSTLETNFCTLSTLPLHHIYGQVILARMWYGLEPLYLFPMASIPLTSTNVTKVLSTVPEIEILHITPIILEQLAEAASEGLQALKRLKMVMFGGSPCAEELGDYLVGEGVRLASAYGLTETGQLLSSVRDFGTDNTWNWGRVKGPHVPNEVHEYVRFEPRGDDTYEIYVLDGLPTKLMSNQPDGSYATRDLFIKHPTIPDAYKYIGRIDDTLVMVNGEKTNPIPIEHALHSSPYIAEAIVFGAGRSQIGALILPSETAQHLSQEELIQCIASVVTRANADAPSHSRLSTEALVILPFGTMIPRADKGSILRSKVYKEFEAVINELYMRLEGKTGSEEKAQVSGEAEARGAVRAVICKIIENPVDGLQDDTDLFEFGLNSLQSTRIRNAIQRGIDLGGKTLPINAVAEHPSIDKLAKLIVLLYTGQDINVLQTNPQELMLKLVEKYSHFMYLRQMNVNGTNGSETGALPTGKVVVLTGATGSLGAFILSELLTDPNVETVYCLCRAKNDIDATDRLAASMQARKLAIHTRLNERIVAIAADLPAAQLGLDQGRYREIVNRVTHIIHNAWAVNFNLGISSFEPHIRGAVNLMHLALASPRSQPAKFFFASSVSSLMNWPGPDPVPEAVTDDPAFAHRMGYAQSKWVTEKLCQIATRKTPMHTTILRLGRLVGDTVNGVWNESETTSLLIKCADTIGLLPELDEQCSWLPMDYAAKSFMELVNLPTRPGNCPVYQILQPARIPWSIVLSALQGAGLDFKRVPTHDWLQALHASDPDERRNPSRKLLGYYDGVYGGGGENASVDFCVEKTMQLSRWLREAPVTDESLAAKWVGSWRESGFLRVSKHGVAPRRISHTSPSCL